MSEAGDPAHLRGLPLLADTIGVHELAGILGIHELADFGFRFGPDPPARPKLADEMTVSEGFSAKARRRELRMRFEESLDVGE